MIRFLVKFLKPLCLALLVLVLAPCVAEFILRLSACRNQFAGDSEDQGLATVPSRFTHHELEPLLRISLPLAEPANGFADSGDAVSGSDADAGPATHEFQTNSFGLRGPEFSVTKSPGTFRIICLGDEAVLAPDVEESRTFCRLLEQYLQSRSVMRVEVINAGVPGYCPLLSYLQVQHHLIGLDPDLIVAHFDMTDVWDDRRFRRLTDTDGDERPLVCMHPELLATPGTRPLTENFLVWEFLQSSLTGLLGQSPSHENSLSTDPRHRYAWLAEDPGEWILHAQLALSACDHLAVLCEKRIGLLLATYPVPWQVSATASPEARKPQVNGIHSGLRHESRHPFELLQEYARTRGLPLCNATTEIAGDPEPDSLYLKSSRGFSNRGHALYAELLATSIIQQFPGPWSSRPAMSPQSRPLPLESVTDRTPLAPSSPAMPPSGYPDPQRQAAYTGLPTGVPTVRSATPETAQPQRPVVRPNGVGPTSVGR